MKYIATLKSCTKSAEDNIQMLYNLDVLKENGFDFDIFDDDGPLYEDDTGHINTHIEYYRDQLDKDITLMRKTLNRIPGYQPYWKQKFKETMCSNCFFTINSEDAKEFKFCPRCGSYMNIGEKVKL